MPKRTLQQRVILIAESEIGVEEQPSGSNTSARIREYQAATWAGGTGWPWCAAFVCWCYRQAGRPLPYPSAGAWDLTSRHAKLGWEVPLAKAKRGDIVSFNVGSGHVALFWDITPDGSVRTIDGNSSNRVKPSVRPASQVRQVIHVPATDRKDPAKPKPPRWQVVTSENGKRRVVFTGSRDGAVRYAAQRLAGWARRGLTVVVRRKK